MATRFFNYRQGDRSEYLATFLLSALGLITPVPRQEDIGFDFHCSIADQEKGLLTFGYPYLMQIKSESDPVIDLCKPADKPALWKLKLGWLFHQELPLLLGVVDKAEIKMAFYSLSPIWFLYYETRDCGGVRLVPRDDPSNSKDIGRPVKKEAVGDGSFVYEVDLGHPICTLTAKEVQDENALKSQKEIIREAIFYGQISILFKKFGVPHFFWFAVTNTKNESPVPAYYFGPAPDDSKALEAVYARLGPALICLALRYEARKDAATLAALKTLIANVPSGIVPDEVKEILPSIY